MPGQPVVLDNFSGLVATARPEDLPEGASPRTWDTDFIVGRVIQRTGERNVYSYAANSFGPNNGVAAASLPTVGNPWLNIGNILALDGSFATSITVSPLTTDNLQVTSFNFTVPSTSVITGISVSVVGYSANAVLFGQLLKSGVTAGEVRSVQLPTTSDNVILGGPTDEWGMTRTFADIDATGFGIVLWVVSAVPATIALADCRIKIFGTESSTNFNGLVSSVINVGTLNIDNSDGGGGGGGPIG